MTSRRASAGLRLLRLLVATAGLAPWALSCAPFAGAAWAAAAFRPLCHQDPERTLRLLGVPMVVCSRCAGVYLGVALGTVLLLPERWLSLGPRLVWGALGAMVLSIAAQDLCHLPPSHPLRVATGLALGWSASAFMFASLRRERADRLGALPDQGA